MHPDIRTENAENRKALMHKRLRAARRTARFYEHALSKYWAYAKRRKARMHVEMLQEYYIS